LKSKGQESLAPHISRLVVGTGLLSFGPSVPSVATENACELPLDPLLLVPFEEDDEGGTGGGEGYDGANEVCEGDGEGGGETAEEEDDDAGADEDWDDKPEPEPDPEPDPETIPAPIPLPPVAAGEILFLHFMVPSTTFGGAVRSARYATTTSEFFLSGTIISLSIRLAVY
jgi:hypothetical protein